MRTPEWTEHYTKTAARAADSLPFWPIAAKNA